jgi:hypothetical protein
MVLRNRIRCEFGIRDCRDRGCRPQSDGRAVRTYSPMDVTQNNTMSWLVLSEGELSKVVRALEQGTSRVRLPVMEMSHLPRFDPEDVKRTCGSEPNRSSQNRPRRPHPSYLIDLI